MNTFLSVWGLLKVDGGGHRAAFEGGERRHENFYNELYVYSNLCTGMCLGAILTIVLNPSSGYL